MIENIRNAGNLAMGGFAAVAGLLGVFVVLVLFYFMIKLLLKFEKK